MKNLIISFISMFLIVASAAAQTTIKLNNNESSIKVTGTSTLHDWTVEAEEAEGYASVQAGSESESISGGRLQVVVDAMNSGKNSMDKVLKKALKKDNHPEIVFEYTETLKMEPIDNRSFSLLSSGDLTIAGETRQVQLEMTGTLRDGNLRLEGQKSFKMSEFNIEPPSAMFGTIKSGDKITVHFSVIFQ
jgi:polyisoprenoid-binding protein YceI